MTAIIFLIVLAILIFVHELGHFLAARVFRIRVDAFKIGFGPKLMKWKRGETEYGINAIPFGGYVKIFGENPDEESIGGPDSSRSFVNKPRWQQAVVLASGVLFNFIFACLLYVVVFSVGVTASTEGFEKYSSRFSDPRVMITYIMPSSPAEKAGLKEGDIIRYVETTSQNAARARAGITEKPRQPIQVIMDNMNDFGGKPVAFEYERDHSINIIGITPVTGLVTGKNAIGIAMDNVADLRLPVGSAIVEGLHYTLILIKETFVGLYVFIANIFVGAPNFTDVAGPIGIAGIVGNAARMGFTYLLMITAIISINLGVVNLIPFPALDGGRILFVILESIFRRRIPVRFANIVNMVGFSLLMLLMITVTWKDIAGLLK